MIRWSVHLAGVGLGRAQCDAPPEPMLRARSGEPRSGRAGEHGEDQGRGQDGGRGRGGRIDLCCLFDLFLQMTYQMVSLAGETGAAIVTHDFKRTAEDQLGSVGSGASFDCPRALAGHGAST